MKILFVGSLIKDSTIDMIVKKSKVKPSNAPVYFEKMLVKGLVENGAQVTVLSVPTVSMYPNGSLLAWGRKKETLDFGQRVTWIPCINLMFFKQLTTRFCSFFEIATWTIRNRNEKGNIILNYSVYPPYSSTTQLLGKLFHVKTCSIITDLPEYLYKMGHSEGLRAALNEYYSRQMVKYQGGYDQYVFLTEHMAGRMKLEDKPSIVMEGFADLSIFDNVGNVAKNGKKTVMYAGRLSEDFNIRALINGFMQTNEDYELWIFGSGDMEQYIKECATKDLRITFFGKVERKNLLQHMKMAHLLISVKSPYEDHANYAFPSKVLEYMASGTAVASTNVGGIPKEYFQYIMAIDGDTAEDISACLSQAFAHSEEELSIMGIKCREYVLSQKNYQHQTKRIMKLFELE
ncbi:MAG: glycosyltransferase [Eubacteriales bacterium]|nr:glycosyltransferase [Eubacteriales bacterium]